MNLTPGSRGTPPQAFTCHWRKVTLARSGLPPWVTGSKPTLVGYPTSHVNTVKEKREIIWKGLGPQLKPWYLITWVPSILPAPENARKIFIAYFMPLQRSSLCLKLLHVFACITPSMSFTDHQKVATSTCSHISHKLNCMKAPLLSCHM